MTDFMQQCRDTMVEFRGKFMHLNSMLSTKCHNDDLRIQSLNAVYERPDLIDELLVCFRIGAIAVAVSILETVKMVGDDDPSRD